MARIQRKFAWVTTTSGVETSVAVVSARAEQANSAMSAPTQMMGRESRSNDMSGSPGQYGEDTPFAAQPHHEQGTGGRHSGRCACAAGGPFRRHAVVITQTWG